LFLLLLNLHLVSLHLLNLHLVSLHLVCLHLVCSTPASLLLLLHGRKDLQAGA
jgi:hypothetical protein